MARVHLRVDPDGGGLLVVDARAALALSASGVIIARGLLDGVPHAEVVERVAATFAGASRDVIERDLDRTEDALTGMLDPGAAVPVTNRAGPAFDAASRRLAAPFRADLALSGREHAGSVRALVDRLWAAGVPHLVLAPMATRAGAGTGGPVSTAAATTDASTTDAATTNGAEVSGRAAAVRWLVREAVEHAEDLGMIAGVRGRATDLRAADALDTWADAGLDHLELLVAAGDAARHDALFGAGDRAAVDACLDAASRAELAVTAVVPLCPGDEHALAAWLDGPVARRVAAVSVFAITSGVVEPVAGTVAAAFPGRALAQVAAHVEELADRSHRPLLWQAPVLVEDPASARDAILAGPRAAGDVGMHVEPDGAVLPPRGPWRPAGSLLRDPWNAIWGHPAFRTYREHVEAPARCAICPGLASCAPGCPKDPTTWSERRPTPPGGGAW